MLNGKTALVTGSVAGLGFAIAEALARAGANVVVNGLGDPADGHAAAALGANPDARDVDAPSIDVQHRLRVSREQRAGNANDVAAVFELIEEIWPQMEELVYKGLVKEIGISNFGLIELHKLLNNCRIRPIYNQI